MHGEQKDMIVLLQPKQTGAYEWPLIQVEWLLGLFASTSLCLFFPVRTIPQVRHRQKNFQKLGYDLDRLSTVDREGGSKDLVTLDNFVQTALQRFAIKWAGHSNRPRHVV